MMRQRAIISADHKAGHSSAAVHPEFQTCLNRERLASVAELNEQFLQLLVSQAARNASASAHSLVRELQPLLAGLDAAACRRAAMCPYLLMDVGFADPQRWLWARDYRVNEQQPEFTESHPVAPKAVALARLVLAYAWHLSHAHTGTARILLGMSARTADVVRTYTLSRMSDLAEQHPEWLQARWPTHLRMWRALLSGAMEGEGETLEQARMRGVQLLAAQARSSALP